MNTTLGFCLVVREVDRIFESDKELETRIFEIIGDALKLKPGSKTIEPGTMNLLLDILTIYKIDCLKGQVQLRE